MKDDQKDSRRDFLSKGIKIGAATIVGGAIAAKVLAESKPGDEMVELMTTDGTLVQVPASEVQDNSNDTDYNVREGYADKKFVMVVDLAKCRNALKCQDSCNKNHYITGENAWLKVYNMQEEKDTAPYWMPMMCQHCDQPACVTVCPVDATFKRKDGIVSIDNERCIGCRFCMAACPYSTRVFNWTDPQQEEMMSMADHIAENSPDHTGHPSVKGTVDKCDFCPHMIDKGELPHCVSSCPNDVFYFGDANEDAVTNGSGQTVRLSELLKERAGYRFMEELGTKPSVYYLPPVERSDAFEDGLENYNEFQSVKKPEDI
jgi:molybdopterin-containing oxidoreductase family iron-sulfur binding subunit